MTRTIGISLMILAFGLTACDGSNRGNVTGLNLSQKNGFSELEARDSGGARPHHVVAVQLEHPDADAGEGDPDGVPGQDTIPYHFDHDAALTFCMQDDDGQAHTMTLRDSGGNEVLSVTAGGDCVIKTVRAGDYAVILRHDGTGGPAQANTVFLQPGFSPLDLSGLAGPPALNLEDPAPTVQGPGSGTCTFQKTVSLRSNGSYLTTRDFREADEDEPIPTFTSASVGATELFQLYACGESIAFLGTPQFALSDETGILTYDGVACLVRLYTLPSPILRIEYTFDFVSNNDGTISLSADGAPLGSISHFDEDNPENNFFDALGKTADLIHPVIRCHSLPRFPFFLPRRNSSWPSPEAARTATSTRSTCPITT